MLKCYSVGTDCVRYKQPIERAGWRFEEFAHSKAVLEVKPKIEDADLIFCSLAQLSIEALLQLSLGVALKKRFYFVVSRTKINEVKEYIDVEREIRKGNGFYLDDVDSEKVSMRDINEKIIDRLVRIRKNIETRYFVFWAAISLALFSIWGICSFQLGRDYLNVRCCWCEVQQFVNDIRRGW